MYPEHIAMGTYAKLLVVFRDFQIQYFSVAGDNSP